MISNKEKRIMLHQFDCKEGNMFIFVLFVFLAGQKWLLIAYCRMESIWQQNNACES